MPTEPGRAFDQTCEVTNQLERSVGCFKRRNALCRWI